MLGKSVPSLYQAVLMGSEMENELAVFGYVRKSFDAPHRIPTHVTLMMSKWFANEIVYLHTADGGHWRVDLIDIFSSKDSNQ